MNRVVKGIISFAVATAIVFGGFVFSGNFQSPISAEASVNSWSGRTPKYIFLFIGDGMSYTQINAANDYLGAVENEGKQVESINLEFTKFPVTGSATTFDSTSFCPDSASTATSIATGYKTLSGVINMDEQKQIAYETISEKLKDQLGYKIGVVSSVPIDHATPAAFYAHQPSRGNAYEIAQELVTSNFDYFAGGGFQAPTGKNKDKENIIDVATKAGYTIADSKEEILAISSASEKVIALAPDAVGGAFPYEIDREAGELSLADYTRKGIEMLYNKTGFFMMVEGGKIDWACHANDASASIQDTIAFDEAVQEAVKFYNKYPKDTLIIVTGDHETGGLAVGYAGTGYSTYLTMLEEQTMSYEAFDAHVTEYRTKKTSFASAMKEVKDNFGLMINTDL
ncbi:MAG: alkaline phosphatase, partial [Vallitaleaceae bacterium]|nr:alkaline phosphatase [Vallitaleaceae bacterium]